jgi:hypothetical protein
MSWVLLGATLKLRSNLELLLQLVQKCNVEIDTAATKLAATRGGDEHEVQVRT